MQALSVRAMSAIASCTLRAAIKPRRMTTSSGTPKKLPPPPERLRRLQEKFQLDDGVPVHLKGGLVDQLLFAGTVLLCIAGMGLSLNNIYVMAFPRSSDQ